MERPGRTGLCIGLLAVATGCSEGPSTAEPDVAFIGGADAGAPTASAPSPSATNDDAENDVPESPSVGTPQPPGAAEPGRLPPVVSPEAVRATGPGSAFALSRVYLGTTLSDGVTEVPDAWTEYGWNLDGRITTGADLDAFQSGEPADVCRPHGDTWSVHRDGFDGIDNSFGANILPLLRGLAPDIELRTNERISSGASTLLLDMAYLGAGSDERGVVTQVYAGTKMSAPPLFDGLDVWPVSPELLVDPLEIDASKIVLNDSYVVANTWVSGTPTSVPLRMTVRGEDIAIEARNAVLVMTLDADRSGATGGIIGGVVPVALLIEALRPFAGRFDESFCDSATFEAFAELVRDSADMLADGTQDTARTCDAISIGIGFDARKVVRPQDHDAIGDAARSPAQPCGG